MPLRPRRGDGCGYNPDPSFPERLRLIQFALTIFLGAFLLFQVQPMIGKLLLPWFGGGAGVWTVCLLFFQVALLLGYAYADLLQRVTRGRAQILVHGAVLVFSLLWLPLQAGRDWLEAAQAQGPTLGIMFILAVTIGLPYVVLASTSPLMQKWFSLSHPGRSPYRLYALSNLGSVLALVTFPFIVEPRLAIGSQTLTWTVLYLAFAACILWCGTSLYRRGRDVWVPPAPDGESDVNEAAATRLPAGLIVFWLALAAVGALMLISATNFLTQDIAPLPLLWIVPLVIYLFSFIICFEYEWLYQRWVFIPLLIVSVFFNNLMFHAVGTPSLEVSTATCLVALFAICMVCHGELARSKPPTRHLTFYYLMIAAGGAIGGTVVALVAPLIFQDYWEYHAGLLAAWLLGLIALVRAWPADRDGRLFNRWGIVLLGGVPLLALTVSFGVAVWNNRAAALVIERNFYGSFRVADADLLGVPIRQIRHGSTSHGNQFLAEADHWKPTGYYGPFSGLGLAIRHFPGPDTPTPDQGDPGTLPPLNHDAPPLRLGVVGLGTGTTAAYVRPGDNLRYYEINPEIVHLAQDYFTFLEDARGRGTVDITLGDARVVLERELEAGDPQQFDILAIDAFTSDAIPVHLLTAEASDIYWQHLQPDGILAVHISNRHLDLLPVVEALAARAGKQVLLITDIQQPMVYGSLTSIWVLVTDNQRFIQNPVVQASSYLPTERGEPILWTDEYASLWSVLGHLSPSGPYIGSPLSGYFVVDQANVMEPRGMMRLVDKSRLAYLRSGREAAVMIFTIPSIAAAAKNAPPNLSVAEFADVLLDTLFRDQRKIAGYFMLYDESRNTLVGRTLMNEAMMSVLSRGELQDAAEAITTRVNEQLQADPQQAGTLLLELGNALCDELVQALQTPATQPAE